MNINPAFRLPEDEWYQLAAPGEHLNPETGFTQVLDLKAFQSMVDRFNQESATIPYFPGRLIDFDHESMDRGKRTTAAGWISELQARPEGLFARVKWSDEGMTALTGGRYRMISPVWMLNDCERLDAKRVRPLRLENAGLCNHPNIKNMIPLSNSSKPDEQHCRMPAVPLMNSASKKRIQFAGIEICIDRPCGFAQCGVDREGNKWSRTYTMDYGFIPKSNGGDDEQLDVFIGPDSGAPDAFLVRQTKEDGSFDEYKLMLGFRDRKSALACYDSHIPKEFRDDVQKIPVSLVQSLCKVSTAAIRKQDHAAQVVKLSNKDLDQFRGAIRNAFQTDDQRKAYFARMGSGGGGRRSGSRSGSASPKQPHVPIGTVSGTFTDKDGHRVNRTINVETGEYNYDPNSTEFKTGYSTRPGPRPSGKSQPSPSSAPESSEIDTDPAEEPAVSPESTPQTAEPPSGEKFPDTDGDGLPDYPGFKPIPAQDRAHAERISELEKIRDSFESAKMGHIDLPDYELIDVNKTIREERAKGNIDPNHLARVRAEGEAKNAQVRKNLEALNDYIDNQTKGMSKTQAAQVRERILRDERREIAKQNALIDRTNERIDREVRKIEKEIVEEKGKMSDLEYEEAQSIIEQENEYREAYYKAAVAKDKEEFRRRQATQREERMQRGVEIREQREADAAAKREADAKEKSSPAYIYQKKTLPERETYWSALGRGDLQVAEQIFPGAPHDKNKSAFDVIASGDNTKALAMLKEKDPEKFAEEYEL